VVDTDYTAFPITTAGITTANDDFRLRLPTNVATTLAVAQGCDFTLKTGIMWRNGAEAQPTAMNASDVAVSNCP